ncbi:MAG: SRPBCC domain-containing protein, partial [Thermoanaerobaculia bacterium]|nr:SRPBCC domain-containing protein [Thermoanaerobaculia bacterium]
MTRKRTDPPTTDRPEKETEEDRRELRVNASPEQLYRAWADPDIIAGWFADRAWGDAQPGGELTHFFEAFGMEMTYRVLEAEAPRRLVLEGRSPGGEPYRQEIHVRQDGGQTVLELVHSGFADDSDWDDEYEGIDSGWQLALAVLRHYLENHFAREKKTLFFARPVDFSWSEVAPLFRSEEGLASWLTDSGAVTEVGTTASLALQGAGSLNGRVLADSGREVALEWTEIEGILELKAFGGGPWPKTLALRV